MSDLFLKNNGYNVTESSINLTNILGIKNNNKINNVFSPTSNNLIGGNGSVTSSANLSKINSADINNLLSMLTSESDINTATSDLENKLKNMLTQNGGSNDTENTEVLENRLINMLGGSNGGDDISTEALENKINSIIRGNQSGGAAKSLVTLAALGLAGTILNKKITNDTETEFNAARIIGPVPQAKPVVVPAPKPVVSEVKPTVSENKIKVAVEVPIETVISSEIPKKITNLSETSTNSVFAKPANVPNSVPVNPPNPFIPLTTTTINNNSSELSATSSAMPDSRLEQLGGNNPALIAFREISAMVAKKLGISNGPQAKKIAGQLQRDVKEKNKDITHDKLVDAARKHLEENLNQYEKMVV